MLYKYFIYGIRQNFFKRVCESAVRVCIASYKKKKIIGTLKESYLDHDFFSLNYSIICIVMYIIHVAFLEQKGGLLCKERTC